MDDSGPWGLRTSPPGKPGKEKSMSTATTRHQGPNSREITRHQQQLEEMRSGPNWHLLRQLEAQYVARRGARS